MMADSKDSAVIRGRQQTKTGVVVSDRMDQTVRVAVKRLVAHPQYGKRVRRTSTFMAHDAGNRCGVGDKVLIVESRPLSKNKRWRVARILEKSTTPAAAKTGA